MVLKMMSIINSLKIYNGDIKDIINKEKNIWLGVSTSLKPYNQELAKKYIQFITAHSKNHALIFIGDEISAINYQELERMSVEKALKKAKHIGREFEERYKQIKKNLSFPEQEKLKILRWSDVWNKQYEFKYKKLKEEYLKETFFREEIENPIKEYLINKKRTISKKRLETLSEYVLRELPFLLEGIEHQGVDYNIMLYPTYRKSLSEFVTNILTNEVYSELRNELEISKKHILIDAYIS